MAIPAIISLLGKILGGVSAAKGLQGKGNGVYQVQPGERRVTSSQGGYSSGMGSDNVQPGQLRMLNQSTGQYHDAPQGSGGRAMNKAGGIANLIAGLRNSQGGGNMPYQVQYSRRRR